MTERRRIRSRYSSQCRLCDFPWEPGDDIFGARVDGESLGWFCSDRCVRRAVQDARTLGAEPWPVAMLRLVPAEWRDRIYRAVARTLHPDAGGDTALAAALNAGRDRMHEAARW